MPEPRRGLRSAACVIVCLAVSPAFADDEERPEATPYRPTVSTPAALSAPGWFEGEFGGLVVRNRASDDEPAHRSSFPYTLKYAFSDDWGVRVGGEALVHVDGDGRHSTSGFGDTGIVLKRRFAIDDGHAFGLEAGALYPTARPTLQIGSGKPDYAVNGIYSADFAGWHADVNLIETRLGAHGDPQSDSPSRWQTTGAFALSHPLSDAWQAEAEWSGTRQTGTSGVAQMLAALAWSVRRDIVVDFGGARGLNRASASWQAFGGVTVVLGRLP